MTAEILTVDEENVTAVIDAFCDAFFDYPIMRFVLGPDRRDYEADLKTLVGLFVNARVYRKEDLLGVRDGDSFAAVAMVSRSTGAPAPPEFFEFRAQVWAELGAEAESRYDACGEAWAPLQVEAPHLHLNMIGVRGSAQGHGLGRRLLERVHQLSREDSESEGISLTTELETNLPLYEKFGYQLLGKATVAPGLTTWGFYRPSPRAV